MIISDADHHHAGEWLDETLRITKKGGFLFFHDTNDKNFPTLKGIESKIKNKGFMHYHFREKSREDERTQREWIFVVKS